MDGPPTNHDADWLEAWREDPAAFAGLVRRWQGPIARFLEGMAGRFAPVPDLCQEVFLKVYLARDRYRETGAFSAWLYRIACNVARDACRRRHPEPCRLPSQVKAEIGGPEARAEQRELAEAVSAALAELPVPLREAVVLRHFEDMSFKDIARVVGSPPSTVRSRFEVGMIRLRARLQRDGWGP